MGHRPVAAIARAGAVAGLLCGGVLAGLAAPSAGAASVGRPAAPASRVNAAYQGQAFGSEIKLGATVASGPTAQVVVGCTNTAGIDNTDSYGALTLPGLQLAGVSTEIKTARSPGPTTTASAEATGVDIAGGMIHAQAISSTATTSYGGGQYTEQGQSSFVGLVVAGMAVPSQPAPNTRMAIPGLGTLTLNDQHSYGPSATSLASEQVEALVLTVTAANPSGLAVGSRVVLSSAEAALTGYTPGVLGGEAYGTTAGVAQASSGRTAPIYLNCLGTGGATLTNSTASVTTPALVTGPLTSTDEGDISGKVAHATSSSIIDNVQVLPVALGGLVNATTVTAVASATYAPHGSTVSDTGSAFTGLTVAGMPGIGDSVPANTVVPVPGVGTLYLHRITQYAHQIEVRMIELDLTAPMAGLPAGTVLVVGDASASAR